MSTDLREELAALAETQPFSADPAAWDRGRRARRNSRLARGAAALAVVALVAGASAVAVRPDTVAPADDVRGGALPSRVPEPDGPVLTDLVFGAASVAYVDTNGMPVLVDATTGEAHWVELPDFPRPEAFEVTADFRRGAWLAVSWTADGEIAVDTFDKGRINKPVPDVIRWVIDPATGDSSRSPLAGIVAPGGGISAPVPDDQELVDAVEFETVSGSGAVSELPTDLYPEGAVVQPIGWVEPDLLVASIDPPQSDVVEHPRLVLVASPERPESGSSFRELLPRLPPTLGLSIAVDMVPDLTGDPAQELTRDFSANSADEPGWASLVYGAAGVLAVLLGLFLLATMGRRRA